MDSKWIDSEVSRFRKMLIAQLDRAEHLNSKKCDSCEKEAGKPIVIGICDGDGIGTVIMAEARKILKVLLKDELESGKVILKEVVGLTIENRLKKMQAVPEETKESLKGCDVFLKGPMTTPKGGTLKSANITLRGDYDLYANFRPVKIPEEGIDWAFFRENTEGEYILSSEGVDGHGLAIDFRIITREGSRRIAKAAFDYARANGKKRVTVVTKANILKKSDGMFSAVCAEVAKDYPEITCDEYYVDIMSANLINREINATFEVMVMPNLYGDILTDEGAQIMGGVGSCGSANIGDGFAVFEAIHGSAPRMIEDGLAAYANPTSILNAAEMLLRHVGLTKKADVLASAIAECTGKNAKITVSGKAMDSTCEQFGNYVLAEVKARM